MQSSAEEMVAFEELDLDEYAVTQACQIPPTAR
ncbi:hypothetical protein GA0115234_102418 [Streptomyces sp. DvalAA-43]|nr:hypothetical protein GA0115234_102418 [Streptomyces sp. DvalAA-43]